MLRTSPEGGVPSALRRTKEGSEANAGALQPIVHIPPYANIETIMAAARGEADGLRKQLEQLRDDRLLALKELRELQHMGTFWLVLHHVWVRWVDALRRDHAWFSVWFTPHADLLVVTRPQRVLVLTATCLASMAINALFFGGQAERISARLLGLFISAACMLPVERLFPLLFSLVNTFRSDTLDVSYAVRQRRRDELAKRRKALLR